MINEKDFPFLLKLFLRYVIITSLQVKLFEKISILTSAWGPIQLVLWESLKNWGLFDQETYSSLLDVLKSWFSIFCYKILLFERWPQWSGNNQEIYFIFYGYSNSDVKSGRSIKSYVNEYFAFYMIPATQRIAQSNLIKADTDVE